MGLTVHFEVLNQLGTPMMYSSSLATQPAAGIQGRIFFRTDSPYGIYRDNGTTWDQIAGSGVGGLTGSGVATRIAYFDSTSNLTSSANLFWDNTNNRLGVNTATPGSSLNVLGNTISTNTLTGITGTSPSALTSSAFSNDFTFNSGITTTASVNVIGLLMDNNLNYSGSNTINATSYNASGLYRNVTNFGSAGASITYTQASGGIRALVNDQIQYLQNGANSGTISHYANIQILGDQKTGAGLTTFTNRYGILINDYNEFSAGNTYTNRWGIYQAGLNESNFFAGKVGIGTGYTPSTINLDVVGTARVSGVLTFTDASTGGSGSLNIGVGNVSPFGGSRNIQIGNFSGIVYSGTRNVALGSSSISVAGVSNIVQIGNEAGAQGSQSIAIGNNVSSAANSMVLGRFCTVSGIGSINLCFDQFNAIQYTIANNYSFNIGSFAKGESSAIYQGIINAQDIYLGRPPRSTSTLAFSLDGSATTINGMGGIAKTDAIGGNLTINGGIGLGAGTSGDVIFGTATPTSSGTTIQTLTSRWYVKGSTGTLSNVVTPNASAQVQIDSTTQGFLPPRMTTAQKNAIATPAAGLMVYDTTLSKLCVYTTAWETITSV